MSDFKNTRAVVLHLSKYITGRTIDFGAGTAKYKHLIKPYTSEYVAFDMVPGENIDVVGDALHPPFPDGSFDTVLSTQTLEHVEKPWVVVSEIRRILKPGGVCLITAPFLIPYHADPYDFFRYTKQGMESLFRNEGFAIEESGRYGNTPIVVAEMFHFAHMSHYTQRTGIRQWFRDKTMQILKGLAYKLDPSFKNDAVYANTYIVARKPIT